MNYSLRLACLISFACISALALSFGCNSNDDGVDTPEVATQDPEEFARGFLACINSGDSATAMNDYFIDMGTLQKQLKEVPEIARDTKNLITNYPLLAELFQKDLGQLLEHMEALRDIHGGTSLEFVSVNFGEDQSPAEHHEVYVNAAINVRIVLSDQPASEPRALLIRSLNHFGGRLQIVGLSPTFQLLNLRKYPEPMYLPNFK